MFWEDDARMKICTICKSEFTVPHLTRHQIMQTFTGKEVQKLVKVGSLIVSTEENSEHMQETFNATPEHMALLSYLHWIKGVYAIFHVDEEEVKAVNITRTEELSASSAAMFNMMKQHNECNRITFTHFNGGPCSQMGHREPSQRGPVAMFRIPTALQEKFNLPSEAKVLNPDSSGEIVVCGPIIHLVGELNRFSVAEELDIKCHVFWGEAIWTRTQFLGEIARGDWGLCRMHSKDPFPEKNDFRSTWGQLIQDQRPIRCVENPMKNYHDRQREEQLEASRAAARRRRDAERARELAEEEEEEEESQEEEGDLDESYDPGESMSFDGDEGYNMDEEVDESFDVDHESPL